MQDRRPIIRNSPNKPNPAFLDNDLLRRFLDALSPLEPKLGPIMFQFEYLNKQKMPSKEAFIERFGEFIDRAPKGYQYAVEVRNKNFYSPAFFDLLKGRGLGFVYVEVVYMPRIGEVFDKFKPETASFQIIRLHGGDRAEIEGRDEGSLGQDRRPEAGRTQGRGPDRPGEREEESPDLRQPEQPLRRERAALAPALPRRPRQAKRSRAAPF